MYFCGIDWSEKKLDYHLQESKKHLIVYLSRSLKMLIGARGHRLFIRNNETADTSIMRLFVLWLIDGSR